MGRIRGLLRRRYGTANLESLEDWRQHLLAIFIAAAVLLGPVGYPMTFRLFIREGHYALVALDSVIWVWALVLFLRPPKDFSYRSVVLLLLVYAMATSFLVSLGPDGARPAWLVFAAVAAALLHGTRAAIAATLANAVLLTTFWLLLADHAPGWERAYAAGPASWAMFVVNLSALTIAASLPVAFLLRGLDDTLKKEQASRESLAEQQAELARARRLEAIGRVTGGVAHDLNNMLTPIAACSSLARRDVPQDSRAARQLDLVLAATGRVSDLLQQLLAFGRDVGAADDRTPVPEVLLSLDGQLRATLPAQVELTLNADDDLPLIRGGKTSLYQVVQNLAQNAVAAAREQGGKVAIHARRATSGDAPSDLETPEDFACIDVVDNGTGMDEDTSARAFEPFFTTKPAGEGTGLGLATVHAIVRAHDGRVTLDTAPGRGTTVRVYWPYAR